MQKSLSILLILFSCHTPTTSTTHSTKDTTSSQSLFKYDNPQLLIYDQWIATLDTQKIENSRLALQRFQQLFTNQPPSICDTAFYLFDRFHDRLALFLAHSPGGDPLSSPGSDSLTRSFLLKQFSAYVSPAMNQFLSQQAKEEKEGLMKDAALLIAPNKLAERTVWWEQFATGHAAFLYEQEARDKHNYYVSILLTGTDNTPFLIDGRLSNYFAEAYESLAQAYGQSETNGVTAAYYTALKFRDTATVEKIRSIYAPPHP